ncbi:unnamed protein product [Allacma fusca]|uniref:Uncharacterized protein n=1 Tax=Allacma fusca TaxID=39272 RepID=A0A8J2P7W1_9HEXA|nr:unnamed protein product [Allacma fusca]
MAHTVVNVLKRMDRDECFVKALCLIQLREVSNAAQKYRLPKDLKMILSALKISANRRKSKLPSPDEELSSALVTLEDAVQTGLNACANPHSNTTICEQRYSICPASREDIYAYIDLIYDYFL